MGTDADTYGDAQSEEEKLLERHCRQLMEHFDTVEIFCSKQVDEEGGKGRRVTGGTVWGEGNFFARYGQVKLWVEENEKFPEAE